MRTANTGLMTSSSHATSSARTHSRRSWAAVRDDLRERREARSARQVLRRQLASYSSPHEIDDLMASVRRRDDAGAEEIRRVLASNLYEHRRPSQFGY